MENLLGPRIKSLRKIRGLTQEQLAERCDVSPSCISRWETGTLYPRRENMDALAKALQVKVEDLLSGLGSPLSDDMMIKEFAPLIEELEQDEQEYFLQALQSYLEMKNRRSRNT